MAYINKRKYDSVVLNCCALPETKEDAHAIIRKENLYSNYEILKTVKIE